MDSSALQIDKTVRLFTYLRELSLLKTPLIRDIQNYENYVFLNEIPDDKDCISPLTSAAKDIWIEIKKPVRPEFPSIPISLSDWISPSYKPENIDPEPSLLDRITNPDYEDDEISDNEVQYLYLNDNPDIQQKFESYMSDQWQPWRQEYIRYEKIQSIYTKLFSVYQKQKKLGEQYELIACAGLLNWKAPDDQLVHRHILTTSCSFEFDSNNGLIRVLPTSEGVKAELEQDMLELENRLDNTALKPIQDILEELQMDFWNKELIDSICRSFVFSLSANGTYKEAELNNKKDSPKQPDILYSPALILRKKTEKGFQQACTKIIENVKESAEAIPFGIKRIFEEMDDYQDSAGLSAERSATFEMKDQTVYFPLEANDEQRKIISNLETRNGVLVQGPPGTGKSHTIANLISHLLSSGQRVLITSETARALKVLKDKIPSDLQDLCVSLLGADTKSFKDLEKVVQIISNNRDTWDSDFVQSEITRLTAQLKSLKEKEASTRHQLRSIREKDTFEHHFLNGAYKGTAQTIADQIRRERDRYSWLRDTLAMDAQCPLSQAELTELLNLLQVLDDNVQEQIQSSFPPVEVLENEEVFTQNANREKVILDELKEYGQVHSDEYNQLSILTSEKRESLSQTLHELSAVYTGLNRLNGEWVFTALDDLENSKFRPWEEFYNQMIQSIGSVKDLAAKHSLAEIHGIGETPLSQLFADVSMLHAHLKEGKSMGLPMMRPKAVKDAWYIVKDVRIDGRKCDTLESVSLLEETVRVDHTLKKMEMMILDHLKVQMTPAQSRSLNVVNIEDIIEPFKLLLAAKDHIDQIKQEYNDIPFILDHPLREKNVTAILSLLKAISLNEELKAIRDIFQQLIEKVQRSVDQNEKHVLVDQLINAVLNRDIVNYKDSITKVNELDQYGKMSLRCDKLLQRLKAILPQVYADLLHSFDAQTWTERFTVLENTMNWAKVNSWLIHFSKSSEAELLKDLNELEAQIHKTITQLGAHKAWYSTLSTMTEGQRQHLLAWTTSMRKVGKGTGKNAHVHLRDAQKHMSECRDAIPAWIMPLYRVFETFDVKPNLFDVVIIDEASQSGPDAVILQYIAKKLIVVGDDKQISPEYVGIKREDIQYLRSQYLNDFKLADMLDIENSFFDLANVLFGGRITLREHFRCMPEIIEFSNRISYTNTPLIPLRQYPPNRLEPIRTVHVPNGYREGAGSKVYNQPEAESIVSQIKACIKNPLYKDKSIGVISLQSEGQAQLIERLLVDEIGTEEIEKRNIICGDAYAFQGDERDIMFLSMVASPGQTAMRAVTTEKDKRRFNVAVSRAKDQLWLYHTPSVNDFRNKECLRYQLISYCENPAKEILESNRALCESDFERSVFDQITARGYRVIPQHEVANYRIDMVVEGDKGRIAVECDGDQWHGPDQYNYDMNRQRILERCGWKFWRVRGSDYYYDPEKALSSLWDTLKYYEIEPIGYEKETKSSITESEAATIEENESSSASFSDVDPIAAMEETKSSIAASMEEVITVVERIPATTIESATEENSTVINPVQDTVKAELSPKANLKQFLISKGLEVVDMRDKQGALWLIGGQELSSMIDDLRKDGIAFTYAYNGSKSTNRQPAWFTSYRD
ncbi:AAA domain-containing protein [Bacillus mesophilum]|uniref:AAA family ATPase n=1 Tax=Bacillus mesophilum TaxID=1071718 RepID=A0A7V7RJU8_9BACI|nr:AAA domain-containing protein [Bacillus mesophilum]KAB2331299.1 AAA family ATPase [Bacillus mesophilum]